MDFYYQPKIAAEVAEYINYISPVPDAQQIVQQDASAASGEDKAYLDAVAKSYADLPRRGDVREDAPRTSPRRPARS